jgi:hypothetical protein
LPGASSVWHECWSGAGGGSGSAIEMYPRDRFPQGASGEPFAQIVRLAVTVTECCCMGHNLRPNTFE